MARIGTADLQIPKTYLLIPMATDNHITVGSNNNDATIIIIDDSNPNMGAGTKSQQLEPANKVFTPNGVMGHYH
jgi:hypothetical protein